MLSQKEKDNLYVLIVNLIGDGNGLKAYKDNFNINTMYAVEKIIEGAEHCNGAIKALALSLVSGARLLTRGWLRRILGALVKELKKATNSLMSDLSGFFCKPALSYIHVSIIKSTARKKNPQ